MYSRNVCLKNKALSHDFYPHLFSLYISFSGVLATPQVQGNLEVKWLVPPSCDYLSTLFFCGARTCSLVKNLVCIKPRPESDQCTFCFVPLLVFNLCVWDCCRLYFLSSAAWNHLIFGAGSIHLFDVTNLQSMISKAMIKNVIRSKIFQCWKTKQLHTSEDNCKVSLCPAWGSPPSCFSMSSTRVLIAAPISMVRSSQEQSQSVDDYFRRFYRYLNRCSCTSPNSHAKHPCSIFSVCNSVQLQMKIATLLAHPTPCYMLFSSMCNYLYGLRVSLMSKTFRILRKSETVNTWKQVAHSVTCVSCR